MEGEGERGDGVGGTDTWRNRRGRRGVERTMKRGIW